MVSQALIKLSSPVAKSCLVAIGATLVIDAVLTIFAATSYPYLIAYTSELYVDSSRSVTIMYFTIGLAALILSISTVWASFKSKTNYVLVHACITGVFLPVSILVYFSSLSSRYKVSEFLGDYRKMITDYRLTNQQMKMPDNIQQATSSAAGTSNTTNSGIAYSSDTNTKMSTQPQNRFTSFINIIDSIQTTFSCCGVDSSEDWIKQWDGYIPPSCCETNHKETQANENWARNFHTPINQEFYFCSGANSHHLGCLAALKEDEKSKFAWLADLIVFLMVMTITNTIVSLLLFGLSKTEDMAYDSDENELAMVGVSTKPRPSQPEITGIRHRPSVVAMGASKEQIATISQAVRFNLSNSPRASISGPSKFSAAARRGSSHV